MQASRVAAFLGTEEVSRRLDGDWAGTGGRGAPEILVSSRAELLGLGAIGMLGWALLCPLLHCSIPGLNR